jgi:uncharacterized membrane protein YfcA
VSLDLTILALASLTFFIGGMAKGAMGFGLPMIAIPVLTAFGSLPLALSIAVPPVVATNVWQLWKFRAHRDMPFMYRFLALGVFGLFAGALVLKNVENAYLKIILGSLVLFYLIIKHSKGGAKLSQTQRDKLAPIVGFFAGMMHGATGLSGLVGTPFFHASGFSRPTFIFINSLMFIIFSTLHMPALAAVGLYQSSAMIMGIIVMIPAFAGLWLGSVLGAKLTVTLFPIFVQGMLIIAAILPIWNGIFDLFFSS